MLLKHVYQFVGALSLLIVSGLASAAVMVVDFDTLADSEALTNQIAGLTFQNSTVLAAGFSLNEFEFPPQSGLNVVVDDGGAITIDFASPVVLVSGYFTYLVPLTLEAFDLGANLVATDLSDFMSNTAVSGEAGSAPNELLSVAYATGIARIVITGDPNGFSFVIDDFTVSIQEDANNVPEPSTLLLCIAAVAAAVTVRRRRNYVA